MAEGESNSEKKRKNAKTLKPKGESEEERESVKSIGKEDWTFDGKKGYEKPSHTGPDVETVRKKEEADEIATERKGDLAKEIAGDDEEYRAERMQDRTLQGSEKTPAPPETEPEEPPEPQEPSESQETEPPEEEMEKYEIRHGMPDVEGETAENLRQKRNQMEERPLPEDRRPADPVNSKLVKDLKDQISEFSDKVDEFSEELNDIDEEVSLLITRMDRLEKREVDQEKMEEKLKELSALYDLLSTDVSPFMEMDQLTEKESDSTEGSEEPEEDSEERQVKEEPEEVSDEDVSNIEKYDMEAMIDWMDFLYQKTGGNIEDALSYYQELGWIDESLKKNILSYSEGIKTESLEEEDKIIGEDGSVESSKGDWKLSPQDHKESLRYIQSIKNNGEISSGSNSGRGEA